MSYSLGQAKLVPGQISFATTPSGRIPSLQPLVEAGLPYAPYIEHGSWVTGQPDIARYGRDPYRGLGQQEVPGVDPGEVQQQLTQSVTETIETRLPQAVLIGTGVVVGAAAGAAGGVLGKGFLGAILGAAGGGLIGYLASQKTRQVAQALRAPGDGPASTGPSPPLDGILAVL